MRWLQGLFFLALTLIVGLIWLLSLYLNSLQDLDKVKRKLQEASQVESSTVYTSIDALLLKTVKEFCTELYSLKPNRDVIARYTTAQGKDAFLPPGDAPAKSIVEMKITIHDVIMYPGDVKEREAEIVAAVNRTITINGLATTSMSYVRLELIKTNSWLIHAGTVIGETSSY